MVFKKSPEAEDEEKKKKKIISLSHNETFSDIEVHILNVLSAPAASQVQFVSHEFSVK